MGLGRAELGKVRTALGPRRERAEEKVARKSEEKAGRFALPRFLSPSYLDSTYILLNHWVARSR